MKACVLAFIVYKLIIPDKPWTVTVQVSICFRRKLLFRRPLVNNMCYNSIEVFDEANQHSAGRSEVMILNTGNRTDIPAYYSPWFYNRVRDGYVLVRNPYYPQQVTRYRLTPDVVDCLCFCTKNPDPMLERLEELRPFNQLWFVTITPYGKDIEPNVPEKRRVMESFKSLSTLVGAERIIWRYDPIFIAENLGYSVDFHIQSFEVMAAELQEYTGTCIISFIDLYAKTKRNFPGVKEVAGEQREQLGEAFSQIAQRYGLSIKSCCEGIALQKYGIDPSGCMTKEVIEQAIQSPLDLAGQLSRARQECGCLLGSDIGAYNTCGHGCLYCYANYDQETVRENRKRHDPESPFLVGGHEAYDEIKDARQESFCSGQVMMELAGL